MHVWQTLGTTVTEVTVCICLATIVIIIHLVLCFIFVLDRLVADVIGFHDFLTENIKFMPSHLQYLKLRHSTLPGKMSHCHCFSVCHRYLYVFHNLTLLRARSISCNNRRAKVKVLLELL